MQGDQPTPGPTFLASHEAPPIPLSATYSTGSGIVSIVFSKPIDPVFLDGAPFAALIDTPGPLFADAIFADPWTVAGSQISSEATLTGVAPAGPAVVTYDGSDPTFRGVNGLAVGAFAAQLSTVP